MSNDEVGQEFLTLQLYVDISTTFNMMEASHPRYMYIQLQVVECWMPVRFILNNALASNEHQNKLKITFEYNFPELKIFVIGMHRNCTQPVLKLECNSHKAEVIILISYVLYSWRGHRVFGKSED